jgi:hypothetical protein
LVVTTDETVNCGAAETNRTPKPSRTHEIGALAAQLVDRGASQTEDLSNLLGGVEAPGELAAVS